MFEDVKKLWLSDLEGYQAEHEEEDDVEEEADVEEDSS